MTTLMELVVGLLYLAVIGLVFAVPIAAIVAAATLVARLVLSL